MDIDDLAFALEHATRDFLLPNRLGHQPPSTSDQTLSMFGPSGPALLGYPRNYTRDHCAASQPEARHQLRISSFLLGSRAQRQQHQRKRRALPFAFEIQEAHAPFEEIDVGGGAQRVVEPSGVCSYRNEADDRLDLSGLPLVVSATSHFSSAENGGLTNASLPDHSSTSPSLPSLSRMRRRVTIGLST